MKSSEQQLHEWAIDEITFDGGDEKTVFTREEFTRIVEALSVGDFGAVHATVVVPSSIRQRKITAQWLLAFSNVLEVVFVLTSIAESTTSDNSSSPM